MFKSPPGQLFFFQFLRVDAFDIILIVISGYARKRHANMRPVGAMVARLTTVQKVACSNHVRVNFYINFYE